MLRSPRGPCARSSCQPRTGPPPAPHPAPLPPAPIHGVRHTRIGVRHTRIGVGYTRIGVQHTIIGVGYALFCVGHAKQGRRDLSRPSRGPNHFQRRIQPLHSLLRRSFLCLEIKSCNYWNQIIQFSKPRTRNILVKI